MVTAIETTAPQTKANSSSGRGSGSQRSMKRTVSSTVPKGISEAMKPMTKPGMPVLPRRNGRTRKRLMNARNPPATTSPQAPAERRPRRTAGSAGGRTGWNPPRSFGGACR